jgi:hypothetical protein
MSGRKSVTIDYTALRRRDEEARRRQEEQRRQGVASELRKVLQAARQECVQASGLWQATAEVAAEAQGYLADVERRLGNLAAVDAIDAEARPELARRLAQVRKVVEAERQALASECGEALAAVEGIETVTNEARRRADRVAEQASGLIAAAKDPARSRELNDGARQELRQRWEVFAKQKTAEDRVRAAEEQARKRRAEQEAARQAQASARLREDVQALQQRIDAAGELLARWSPEGLLEIRQAAQALATGTRGEPDSAEQSRLQEQLQAYEKRLVTLLAEAEGKNARTVEREALMREVSQALGELGLVTTGMSLIEEGEDATLVLDVAEPDTGLWMRWEFAADPARSRCYASHSTGETCGSHFEAIREHLRERGLTMSYEQLGPLPDGDAAALEVEGVRGHGASA